MLLPKQSSQSTPSQSEFARSLCSSLREAYQYVCKSSFPQIKRQEELYNRKVHGMPHKKGSLVWLYDTVILRGHSKKFHRPWTGPYQVVKQLSESTYRVRHVLNNHYKNVHFDRLKQCSPHTRFSTATPPTPTDSSPETPPPISTHLEIVDTLPPPTAPPPTPPPLTCCRFPPSLPSCCPSYSYCSCKYSTLSFSFSCPTYSVWFIFITLNTGRISI